MNLDFIAAVKSPKSKSVFLVGLVDDGNAYKVHYALSKHYSIEPKSSLEIVRKYKYEDIDDIETCEIQFEKDFGPEPQKPCARLGWIAPNGDFYPCAYGTHNDLSVKLYRKLYGENPPCYGNYLEDRGWIAIKGGGIISVGKRTNGIYMVSLEQKHTLLKVVEAFEELAFTEPNWDHLLAHNPEHYFTEVWITPPSYSYTGSDNFPEQLRSSYELYFGEFNQSDETKQILAKRKNQHPGD